MTVVRGKSRLAFWASLYGASVIAITVAASSGYATPVLSWVNSVPGGDLLGHFLLLGGLAFLLVQVS